MTYLQLIYVVTVFYVLLSVSCAAHFLYAVLPARVMGRVGFHGLKDEILSERITRFLFGAFGGTLILIYLTMPLLV